jgi:phage terminase large subunit-like protein
VTVTLFLRVGRGADFPRYLAGSGEWRQSAEKSDCHSFSSRGRIARAEPVAALFENEEARFAGRFPALEDALAGMTTGGTYQGPGLSGSFSGSHRSNTSMGSLSGSHRSSTSMGSLSPGRADAMVWAMTELMRPRREPSVRAL